MKNRIIAAVSHIDQTNWLKTIDEMVHEFNIGDAIAQFEPTFARIVNVGYCIIQRSDGKLLKELETRWDDGRVVNKTMNQNLGGKLRLENSDADFEMLREISEELGIPFKLIENEYNFGRIKFVRVEEVDNPTGIHSVFPGVPVKWTNYWYHWNMPDIFVKDEYVEIDGRKMTTFIWG